MILRYLIVISVLAAGLPHAAMAQVEPDRQQAAPPPPPTVSAAGRDSAFALTIYSTADPALFDPQEWSRQVRHGTNDRLPGYGVVRETRKIDLRSGINLLRFTDVASGIDPTTVSFKSLTAPQTTVLEQSYEYDVVNSHRLLQKHIGKKVAYRPSREAGSEVRGTLLSYDGNYLIQADPPDRLLQVLDGGTSFASIALLDTGELLTKPTLTWQIESKREGAHQAQVTYQTDGLTWRADYNVVVHDGDTAADLGAWVTIVNQSGASYPGAKLKLVAGNVQRLKPDDDGRRSGGGSLFDDGRDDEPGFKEKSFFEYHLYTLGRPTSLNDNSSKQIELFPTRSNVPVQKQFVYYGLPDDVRYRMTPTPSTDRDLGTKSNPRVDVYLSTTNSEANNLGVPLPAGRIRCYKLDPADDSLEFIGEDVIAHTPKDEKLLFRLGSAFDIVGERRSTDFAHQWDRKLMVESIEIVLRNHKPEPVRVIIKENLFRWFTWEITARSDDFEKQDSRTIHFPVDVPANGEKKVTYTVQYTW